jgi:hypothetical protein
MPILTAIEYINKRENYLYDSPETKIEIRRTAWVSAGVFYGIWSGSPLYGGISIRKFESIVQSVFFDCAHSEEISTDQIENLKKVSSAIVHWKMASQGGRSENTRDNVLKKWTDKTTSKLMCAYRNHSSISMIPSTGDFEIGGVRIATASAFLRFLFPHKYGIVDSRVAGLRTNPGGFTKFKLREDNYINDVVENCIQYNTIYSKLLIDEANWLNSLPVPFTDADIIAKGPQKWRPCDVEMALW